MNTRNVTNTAFTSYPATGRAAPQRPAVDQNLRCTQTSHIERGEVNRNVQ